MLDKLFKEILEGWVTATKEQFSDHPLAIKLRTNLKKEIQNILDQQDIHYKIKASAGSGNWANVPWLSMLEPDMTESTQEGIYPVYLFRADGTGIYLSLGLGTTNLKELYGAIEAKEEAEKIVKNIHLLIPEILEWGNESIDLKATTELGKSYEWGTAGAKFYATDNIPEDKILRRDLLSLINIYQKIPKNFMDSSKMKSLSKDTTSTNLKKLVYISKPFILLAGISGTGKTRFVREQAIEFSEDKNNYCLISVRPDWHEPSDLLGYVSRLSASGNPEYVSTKLLDFIINAWKVIAPEANNEGHGDLNYEAAPYWLCLDEMNLAPVEQYFADYLSVLETREFNDDGTYMIHY